MDALGLRDASPRAPSTTFVGRADELALLDGLLGDASVRLVTITGPAGVGKSRLAAEHLLRRSRASGAAGVHTVELSAVHEAALVDDAIVAALPDGAPLVVSAASRLWELYAGDPVLLLLDNLEQIDAVGDVLLRLLADYPQLQVLATSITPARVVGEHLLRLAPFPEGADPDSDPSVALFESRARAADATFALDESSVPTVRDLCRLLGGLPLAIEIAAARVASVPPGLMLRQLATSSADQVVRQGRTAGVPDRHLSVGAALDWTVRLLPTTSIDVLTQVSVFEAPFSLGAAMGVIDPTTDVPDLLDRLSDLVDVQLLALDVADPDEPRFALSAVVRAYAQRRLRESGREKKVRQAHAAYWSERCRQDSSTARSHWPDVDAALDFAVLNGWSDEALRLAVSAAPGLSTSPGAESTLLPRMQQLLAAEHRRDDQLEATALLWSTVHTPADGDDPMAYGARTAQRLARSVEVARASGDDAVLLRALEVVVRSLVVTFDLPAAIAAMQEGLALATRTGDMAALARFEVWAAMAASQSGDLERASALARSAYDRGLGAGDDTAVVYAATLLMRMPASRRGSGELPSLEMLLERAGRLGQAIVTLQVLEALSERDLAAGDVGVRAPLDRPSARRGGGVRRHPAPGQRPARHRPGAGSARARRRRERRPAARERRPARADAGAASCPDPAAATSMLWPTSPSGCRRRNTPSWRRRWPAAACARRTGSPWRSCGPAGPPAPRRRQAGLRSRTRCGAVEARAGGAGRAHPRSHQPGDRGVARAHLQDRHALHDVHLPQARRAWSGRGHRLGGAQRHGAPRRRPTESTDARRARSVRDGDDRRREDAVRRPARPALHRRPRRRRAGAAGRVERRVRAPPRRTGRRRTCCSARCATAPPSSATARCYVRAASYGEALRDAGIDPSTVSVVDPTSYAARRWVREQGMTVLPARGFTMAEDDFHAVAGRAAAPVLEDFYRHQRRRLGLLVEPDGEPEGGRWNFDADNRLPPPKGARTLGLPHPWRPSRTISTTRCAPTSTAGRRRRRHARRRRRSAHVRRDSRRGLSALDDFVAHRLALFGPYEDAVLQGDWAMAHSLLSVPLNLGLLDPLEVVDAAIAAYRAGDAPLAERGGASSRQVVGWREWAWQLYWALGEEYAAATRSTRTRRSPTGSPTSTPTRSRRACLRSALADVRDRGLEPPHRAAHGARQLGAAARLRPAGDRRLVPRPLRRRLRLGDGHQRRRHGALRRRRPHGDQAVRRRRRLPQPHDRPLPRLRATLRPCASGRRPARSPPATGSSSTATPTRCAATTGWRSRTPASPGSPTARSCSPRRPSAATIRRSRECSVGTTAPAVEHGHGGWSQQLADRS